MRLRSARRHPESSIEELLPTFDESGHRVLGDECWRSETREQVREAIGRLPEKYRAVILLRDIEGLSTEEAAPLLGTTPTAVKIRLHRARQALRGLLLYSLSAPFARSR